MGLPAYRLRKTFFHQIWDEETLSDSLKYKTILVRDMFKKVCAAPIPKRSS